MTNSSLLGGERAPQYAAGRDVDALGPSDSSDSGSDVQGEHSLQGEGDQADELGSLIVDTASDSDSSGTGERASATGRDRPDGADIAPDRVVGPMGPMGPMGLRGEADEDTADPLALAASNESTELAAEDAETPEAPRRAGAD